jgi:hypothetical protein
MRCKADTRVMHLVLRDVIAPPTYAIGLVQEIRSIAQRCFGVLVDGNNDRLDVMIAVALKACSVPDFGQRLNPGRIVGVGVVPFERVT